MVRILLKLDGVIHEAADRFSPALIANYAYELAKSFNQFYHDHPIIDPEHSDTSKFRLNLCSYCAAMIHKSTQLLGIGVPEKM